MTKPQFEKKFNRDAMAMILSVAAAKVVGIILFLVFLIFVPHLMSSSIGLFLVIMICMAPFVFPVWHRLRVRRNRRRNDRKSVRLSAQVRQAALQLQPPVGMGAIYIVRREPGAEVMGINAAIDGLAEGQMMTDEFLYKPVLPGAYKLTAWLALDEKKELVSDLTVRIASGECVIVWVSLNTPFSNGIGASLKLVKRSSWERRLKTCQLIAWSTEV